MFNPGLIFELQNKWQRFTDNHPKFPAFLRAVANTELNEGSVIEIGITTAEGQNIASNVKLTREDVDMLKEVAELMKSAGR